jgi:hypothetical protein
MNRNVAAPIFWKGSAKRYVYNCRHLPFENANRDVAINQAGLNFCRGFAPLSGIPATHPTNVAIMSMFQTYLMGLAVAHLAWFHFFKAGQLLRSRVFLTSRTHFRFLRLVVRRVSLLLFTVA